MRMSLLQDHLFPTDVVAKEKGKVEQKKRMTTIRAPPMGSGSVVGENQCQLPHRI